MAGGANKVAGPASHTCFRVGVEGGCHLHFRATAGEVNCPSTYPFAHAGAQSAKNATIIVQLEPGFIDTVLGRQILDEVVVGAASQEELNDHLPVMDDLLGVGFDFHAPPHRIVAGGDKSRPFSFRNTHSAYTAQPGRLKGFMVTESGYVDVVLLCNLKNCCPFFSLDFFAVECEGYHVSFLR